MDIIFNNPFRVLGLPVTASARQITKRVHDLSMLSEFGKVGEYVGDLQFISNIDRTSESIERAAQDLELPARKLHFANFWFWIDNSVDELAMEVLRDGDVEKALSLWGRPLENKKISARTISNYKNHTLLTLIGSGSSELLSVETEPVKLRNFIQNSVEVLSHTSYVQYAEQIAGKTYEVESDVELIKFADEVFKATLNGSGTLAPAPAKVFISSFNGASHRVQQHVRNKITAQRLKKIETLVDAANAARKRDPALAYKEGKLLSAACKPEITYLRQLLSADDPHLAGISDKVAEELINCSTDYYNEIDEMDQALTRARDLTERAQQFATGLRTKKRVNDDLALISKLENQHRYTFDVDQITSELNRFRDADQLPNGMRLLDSIKRLLGNTRAPLQRLVAQGGEGKALYEQFGSLVAQIALVMCIKFANETGNYVLVLPLMGDMEQLPMPAELRRNFNNNKNILASNIIGKSNNKASAGGCYIATLVYGGSEEPAVMELRLFRDAVLLQSWMGRKFVQFYYLVAPTLVLWLKHAPCVQKTVRKCLDHLIRRLR